MLLFFAQSFLLQQLFQVLSLLESLFKELFHENFPPVSRFIPAGTFIVFGNFPTSKFIQDSRVHHILILNRKRVGVILEMSPLLNVYTSVNYSALEYLLTTVH